MAKRPRAERRRMQQQDDSGDEFSDVDEELEASDVDDEAPSSDDDDAGEYAAALAELGAARRKAGVDGDDDDDDEEINEDASDSDDEAFEAVVERTTKKGATVYQVTLCPETAPFTTRAAADEFMRPRLRPPITTREVASMASREFCDGVDRRRRKSLPEGRQKRAPRDQGGAKRPPRGRVDGRAEGAARRQGRAREGAPPRPGQGPQKGQALVRRADRGAQGKVPAQEETTGRTARCSYCVSLKITP